MRKSLKVLNNTNAKLRICFENIREKPRIIIIHDSLERLQIQEIIAYAHDLVGIWSMAAVARSFTQFADRFVARSARTSR